MGNAEALQGRVALITGGGRGIGRAIALAFAQRSAQVCVAARSTTEIERVEDECRRFGADAVAVRLDVEQKASCENVVKYCHDRWGHIDILVNNAGHASSQKFTDIDDETWNCTLGINLTGAFLITRAALPGMLQKTDGAIISIASIAGKEGSAYTAAYTAAKHGLVGMMRALAAEYAKSGVTFNCICPGYVDSPMTEHTIAQIMEKTGRTREQAMQALLTPQGRLIDPEEVAALCVFLAGAEGRSINGQAINVDGGQLQS